MCSMAEESAVSRRDFLKTASAAAVATAAFVATTKSYAQDGTLTAGLIGCGGRGSGAVRQWLEGNENVKVTALADLFEDRLNGCRDMLINDKGQTIDADKCYTGFDCYKRLIDESGVDVVLLASTPYFRHIEFPYAIAAGKHVFMEKPIAVDPMGAKAIVDAAKLADEKGLNVVCGTQRRHEASYLACLERVRGGMIGEIVGGRAYWNGGPPWGGWDSTEVVTKVTDQVRGWLHFPWLSGDHIVEQHVHNIDAVLWFMDKAPRTAYGMGYRARRTYGQGYDFFAIDFDMGNGVSVESQCRQIVGCDDNVSDWVIGTKGFANCWGEIWDLSGNRLWRWEGNAPSPYVQEHTDLGNAIRGGGHVNDAHGVVRSCIAAIMGRTSAYTGKRVSWDDIANATWTLGPKQPLTLDLEYDPGPVPVPGITKY